MLSIKKVLISDKVDVSCKDILEKHSIAVDYKPGLSKDDLKAIIKDYDALIVRSATKVTDEIFACATNLKLVGRAGTGVDNIDLKSASKHGVLVMNTPGGNTLSAAEHTCALISSVARHVGQGYASLLAGKWERSKFMGNELMGKTLAIVGLGRIGREVALRMQAYGVKTIGYDPIVSKEVAEASGIEYLTLDEIWPRADFVTVHTPLIPATKGLVNAKVFNVCKPGLKVINVARGGIVDESDLLQALNEGKCGGAALDVFVTEPPSDVSLELVKHPKVIATPHLGASTTEAQLRVAAEISEQIVDAVQGKPMVGLVNAPALAESCNPLYKPWMELAEKVGKLTACIQASLSDVSLVTRGTLLNTSAGLMMAAFSCGLAKHKDKDANVINAKTVLSEAGINVTSERETESPHQSLSVRVGEKILCTGVISGGLPALSQLYGLNLASPVVMTSNLVAGESSELSSKDLMKLLADIEVSSVSIGVNGCRSVIAATYGGNGISISKPLVSIQL